MGFFISLGILIAVVVILLSMQLSPSIFSIFYHYASGKKNSQKADSLSLAYILGVETFSALTFLLFYAIFFFTLLNKDFFDLKIVLFVSAGILAWIGLINFLCYFRKGNGTSLFIPRAFATKFTALAKTTNTPIDAFLLGNLINIIELPFTLPLYIISAAIIMDQPLPLRYFIAIGIILAATIPTFACSILFHKGYNLAEIQRLRVKLKNTFRVLIPIGFFAIAILFILNGVFING